MTDPQLVTTTLLLERLRNADDQDAWRQLDGRGLIVTPGEVVNTRSRQENVDRLRTAIEATG